MRFFFSFLFLFSLLSLSGESANPYEKQVARLLLELKSSNSNERRGAAEALGFLRAPSAAEALAGCLEAEDAELRCNATVSLAWCGGKGEIPALLHALEDEAWSVRQAAAVALENLTGQNLPFDALATEGQREEELRNWQTWWKTWMRNGKIEEYTRQLSKRDFSDLAAGCPVIPSSTYRGEASALTRTDDERFWQTKNVAFPQFATVDLGTVQEISCVWVEQHSDRFRMTDYELALSLDGKVFTSVFRKRETSERTLQMTFPMQAARFVRVLSHDTLTPTYPTTWLAINVYRKVPRSLFFQRQIRALRALGTLGRGDALAVKALLEALRPYVSRHLRNADEKEFVQVGLRAVGRCGGEGALELLTSFLDNVQFARYAADALGDLGDSAAVAELVLRYPRYARSLARKWPAKLPADDRPFLEWTDRRFETSFAIMAALSRLASAEHRELLRPLAALLLANIPSDFDALMLYKPEMGNEITAYLLELAGRRREAILVALRVLSPEGAGDASKSELEALAAGGPGGTSFAAIWLAALVRPGEFASELQGLLRHENGWVRINAAKALMFCRAREARRTVVELLANSTPEANFGYNGRFLFRTKHRGQDEYNAPSPCWREAFIHALGVLGEVADVPLLGRILNDERNVIEVQTGAAEALGQLGGESAEDLLRRAAVAHPFHSVRLLAREKLMLLGADWKMPRFPSPAVEGTSSPAIPECASSYVFIRGPNPMPNDMSIDIWRQTYTTTDGGPTYRIGHSLWRLDLDAGQAIPRLLSDAGRGWIADCEVSPDGKRVVFTRRGGDDDPWWHVFEIGADGSGLRQLTSGPYHDVGPAYLPDGRIVFSTSRIGARDEYHGYPATGLAVMQADGDGIHCIGFNVGRDDEPAVLDDGRIVFGRLELFYSRLKTERTLHAVFPDGSGDLTLYGPERRDFWRQVTLKSKERWWQESGPRHRVLRLTQPQPFPTGEILCITTGGITFVGPGRFQERILPRFENMAVTSPFPLPDGRIVCAATKRVLKRGDIDLGLYFCDADNGKLTLLYNDPKSAEFEPRPLLPRKMAPVLSSRLMPQAKTATLLCDSVFATRNKAVRERGRFLRIVEGIPPVSRHHTHTSSSREAWKNHTGTLGRVLGTVPLAADGSFNVEVPADRLFHCQVLDSDRRVLGNQLVWMYARPGESRSCVGCHESGDIAPATVRKGFSQSHSEESIPCLPLGGEFLYRAKLWQKGVLSDEDEERIRTVRAVNLFGRY